MSIFYYLVFFSLAIETDFLINVYTFKLITYVDLMKMGGTEGK